MKQCLATAFLTAVALFGLTQDSEARGGKFRQCRGGCDSGCEAAPCATTAHAPAPIQYEDRKVTVYKQVMTEKEIEVLECRRVVSEEKYHYTVNVPVTRQEKYQYTVSVPVTRQEKRMVVVHTPTYKDVDYTYTVMVPKTVSKTVQCTTYHCTRENIVEQVPVCRTVCVTCVDECGRCHTRRERVTVMEERTRCVVKRVPVVTEQVVNVTICEPEQRKGKRTVCEMVRSEKETLVNVCSYENQAREGVRTVCSYETQKREGTRQVCNIVTEKVKRKVQVCTTVAEETTVRVAVGGGSACCDTTSDCGHGRRSLFGGGRRGHSRGASCCN